MSKVSAKRQITLPKDQCAIAGIYPGDEVIVFADRSGTISIVKKIAGAAKGILKGIKADPRINDIDPLTNSLER